MFDLDHPHKSPLFDFYSPLTKDVIGILSIPHSGELIPDEFRKFLSGDGRAYQEDVDFKVNELVDIQALQKAGVVVLVAHVHRICVDLNRAENNAVLFWKQNTQGRPLVVVEPTAPEVERFIETYHHPYYEILKATLRELEKSKKLVSMIDLHSMPSRPTAYHMKQNPNQKEHRPDFCLSDRNGLTCAPEFIEFFQKGLEKKGFEASLNDPYVGGHVTEYVNQFRTNNIQIEIKRGIYMDEESKKLHTDKVERLRSALTDVLIAGFRNFNG
jgi:N-formylglutamate deformylase